MEDEMANKFPNVNKLKNQIENDKQDMQKMRVILDQIKPGLEKQMTYHSMKHDTLKNLILQNQVYKDLDSMEKNMMFNET